MTVDLLGELSRHYDPAPPARLGVAVSGGGDSVALLCLLASFSKEHDTTILCATVDHGLRPEAAAEAEGVAGLCQTLGIQHETLQWRDWDGAGNTQDAARTARYDLLSHWAQRNDLGEVALGHTQDDQAETVLMRMARAAGVDGLSAMLPRRMHDGVVFGRPLLGVGRTVLRDYLKRNGVTWVDDPSNDDQTYDRIKARRILTHLAPLGVDAATLGQIAQNMQNTRAGLDAVTLSVAASITRLHAGALRIEWAAFERQPDEIQRRLLVSAIGYVSGGPYAPRQKSVQRSLCALKGQTSATLDGCFLLRKSDALWVCRELKAVEDTAAQIGALWDGHWRVSGPTNGPEYTVRAIGPEGLSACADWRNLGLPREVLMVTPAVWKEAKLISAPLVKPCDAWQAEPQRRSGSLFDGLFSH